MRERLSFLLLAGLLCPAGARAQERSVGDDIRDMGRDAWFVVRAPAGASAADLQTTALLAAGAGALLLLDEPIHDWLQAARIPGRALRPFGKDSPLNLAGRSYLFLLPLSVLLYAGGHGFDSPDLRDAGLGCATSVTTTTLTRSSVAYLVGRLRPLVGRGPFHFELLAFGDWDQRSFPGGHASNIMSCASFFNHRFDLGPVEPALYGLAFGIGAARMVDQAHWASDTYVGLAYGYAVGRAIAGRSRSRAAERSMQPAVRISWRIMF